MQTDLIFRIMEVVLFSILALYMFTVLLVVWVPEDDDDVHVRKETVVIANSLMLTVLATVASALVFSWVGQQLVDMPYYLVKAIDAGDGESTNIASRAGCRTAELQRLKGREGFDAGMNQLFQ